jgi:hypothetical protein
MEANPKGDWTIEDVRTICNAYGLAFTTPKRGSHCTITHETQPEILTIPARRPIKPIYIRHFVRLVRRVIVGSEA